MSDVFWTNLPNTLLAMATLLAAIGSMWASRRNGRKLDQVATQVDGQTKALIETKEIVAHAAGELAGKAIGKEQAKAAAAELAVAVAAQQASDQVLRAEGRALGLIRTRHDDPKQGGEV
jgi:hypothetical protein